MEKLDTLILLLSCQKTKDRREACRETYLFKPLPPGMKAVFLIGRPGEQPALSGDVLYLDCSDKYLDLPQKIWHGIREAFTRWDFDWIFKADDDTWVNPLRILQYPKTRDYLGRKVGGKFDPNWHVGKCLIDPQGHARRIKNYPPYGSDTDAIKHTPHTCSWAGGGTGYFLSKHAAELVAEEPMSHVYREDEVYEDRFVGQVMGSHGIYLHGKHDTMRDNGLKSNIFGATTIHPLKPLEMREAYWRLHRAGEIGT
jgi:hypothetical protein